MFNLNLIVESKYKLYQKKRKKKGYTSKNSLEREIHEEKESKEIVI